MSTTYYAPRFQVRIAGITMAADLSNQVTSVTYDNCMDIADMFSVTLRNSDNQFTDLALFDLGKTVEIHLGYGDNLRPMMLGEITSIEPSFPEGGSPMITVSGYDKSYRMRHNEPDRGPFKYMTDSLIAAELALENGLLPVVDPSPFFHKHIQQTGSDMAFLTERARANFFDVYVWWNELHFQLPLQTEAYVLEWGKNLSSFTPRLSSAGQAGLQIVRGYNEQLAEAVVGLAMAADLSPENIVEKLGSDIFELLVSLGRRTIRTHKVSNPFDAELLATSVLQQLLEGLYEGNGSCIGLPALRAGQFVVIQGVGKRFSGKYKLKKVTHTINDSGYRTTFEVTQRSGAGILQLLRKSIADEPPPNRQQPYYGLAIGKVTKNTGDTENSARVKVEFPWFSSSSESAWARCMSPSAADGRGFYFLPDVGDEVVVAFEHGSFDNPVVLGSVWRTTAAPPEPNLDGLNRIKEIKTKAGHTITFDDTTGAEKIEIKHKIGSTITLTSTGAVEVTAKTDITLGAPAGTINLNAANVRVKVTGTMDVS
jgi:phage protein D/phage baseplate assembly protein gpV